MGWWDRNKHLYPANWEEIAAAIKARANGRCAACDRPSGPGHVLTVHHLNHRPAENDESNLVALCQVCHLRLGPCIYTKDEAIRRLRVRFEGELGQLCLALYFVEGIDGTDV